jgi:hypothetical protein
MLHPPSWDILFKATWNYIPSFCFYFLKYLPTKEYKRFSDYLRTAFRTAKGLVNEKTSDSNEGGKDILSILSKFVIGSGPHEINCRQYNPI